MKGSKIKNIEWGLLIGAVAIIDLVQVVLDLLLVGVAANRAIDIVVGVVLPFYFYMRGVKMDTKKILSIVGAFGAEEVPVVDALPLWTLDVVGIMVWDKADKAMAQAPVEETKNRI